jgi:hypothetical protein
MKARACPGADHLPGLEPAAPASRMASAAASAFMVLVVILWVGRR